MKKGILATTLIFALAWSMPIYASDKTADKVGSAINAAATATNAAASAVNATASAISAAASAISAAASAAKASTPAASAAKETAPTTKEEAGNTPSNTSWKPAPDSILLTGVILSILIAGMGITLTLNALADAKLSSTGASTEGQGATWLLAQALSEEVEITDADGRQRTIFVASSSRLIAFIALTALIALIVGMTPIIIWGYAAAGQLPGLGALATLIATIGGAFLPYAANQARAAIANRSQNP